MLPAESAQRGFVGDLPAFNSLGQKSAGRFFEFVLLEDDQYSDDGVATAPAATECQCRPRRDFGQYSYDGRIARQAAGRFHDQLIERQAVGQLNAGQGF